MCWNYSTSQWFPCLKWNQGISCQHDISPCFSGSYGLETFTFLYISLSQADVPLKLVFLLQRALMIKFPLLRSFCPFHVVGSWVDFVDDRTDFFVWNHYWKEQHKLSLQPVTQYNESKANSIHSWGRTTKIKWSWHYWSIELVSTMFFNHFGL